MTDDKREHVRLASDVLFPVVSIEAQELERGLEILRAHERARLSVLNLTRRDKEFLRELKIEAR